MHYTLVAMHGSQFKESNSKITFHWNYMRQNSLKGCRKVLSLLLYRVSLWLHSFAVITNEFYKYARNSKISIVHSKSNIIAWMIGNTKIHTSSWNARFSNNWMEKDTIIRLHKTLSKKWAWKDFQWVVIWFENFPICNMDLPNFLAITW